MPAIVENSRSRGVATVEAIVSGLAPGTAAVTEIVGESPLGKAAAGRLRNARIPNSRMANVRSAVITGRSMKIRERFMTFPYPPGRAPQCGLAPLAPASTVHPLRLYPREQLPSR